MTLPILYNHTATLLEDGRVLVIGGQTRATGFYPPPSPLAGVVSAEIYDPSTGRWSLTSPMSDPRTHHAAVLLEDSRVLVAGGLTDEFTLDVATGDPDYVLPIASAEVYDPSTETWSSAGDMPEETVRATAWKYNKPAILLERQDNGKVLAVGGLEPSAALYDPSSGTWASFGPAASSELLPREWHASALLWSGKVLYIGGSGGSIRNSVDLYEPLTGSVSRTGSMITRRSRPTAAVLADGRVLVSGGHGWIPNRTTVSSAEVYDPSSGTWSGAGEMAQNRINHTMTVLSDGRVLVVGGGGDATEIYDPSTGDWSKAADTIEHRGDGHTATLLKDGRVLVVGGASGSRGQPFPTASAEVYDPVADTWTPSTEAAR